MRSSFLPKCKPKIKVEIFVEQREVAFLSPIKIWISLLRFLPYQTNKDHSQKNCLHSPKKSDTILVCLVGQKSLQFLVCILGEAMNSKIDSEFNWPLVSSLHIVFRNPEYPKWNPCLIWQNKIKGFIFFSLPIS